MWKESTEFFVRGGKRKETIDILRSKSKISLFISDSKLRLNFFPPIVSAWRLFFASLSEEKKWLVLLSFIAGVWFFACAIEKSRFKCFFEFAFQTFQLPFCEPLSLIRFVFRNNQHHYHHQQQQQAHNSTQNEFMCSMKVDSKCESGARIQMIWNGNDMKNYWTDTNMRGSLIWLGKTTIKDCTKEEKNLVGNNGIKYEKWMCVCVRCRFLLANSQ